MRGGAKIDNNNNRIAFVFNPCLRQVYSGARPGRRRRGLFGCGGRPSRSQPGLEMTNVGVSKECAGHTPGSQVQPRLDLRAGSVPGALLAHTHVAHFQPRLASRGPTAVKSTFYSHDVFSSH